MPTFKPRGNKKIPRRKHKRKPLHSTDKESDGNISKHGRKQQNNLTPYQKFNLFIRERLGPQEQSILHSHRTQ
jgi:hypothetical protein